MKTKKVWGAFVRGVAIAAAFGFIGASAHAEDLLKTVQQRGTLIVGMEGTYPPFNSRTTAGDLEGFDVDVAKAVASKLGVKTQFITTEWSGIIAGLQAGKFDVIVNQVTITPQRQEILDFSQPYTYSAAQLIQRKDDKREFKSLDEFKGDKKLGVTLGTNYDQMARAVPGINVQTYPGAPEKLRDLAAGRIDATMDDRLMLPSIMKTANLPLRAGAILKGGDQQMGIPFRKGNPKFKKAINDALTSLTNDGTLKKISIHWFGMDVTRPISQ